MATRTNIRADVLNLIGTDANASTAELNTHIQLVYEDLYVHFPWSSRLLDFVVSLVAQITNGTTESVTVTNGSATVSVTGAGTPFTSAMTGRQIQIGAEPQYFFVNFVSSSSITIRDGEGTNVNWPRATATSQAWKIRQTLYTLPSDGEVVVSLCGDQPMDEYDGGRTQLDVFDPDRSQTSDHPSHWLYAGMSSSFVREIEVWPVPTVARLLRGQYRRAPRTLDDTAGEIDIPRSLLVYAVTADVANMLYAKSGSTETSWKDMAIFYTRQADRTFERVRPMDYERNSPPRGLGWGSAASRLRGTDYEVTHLLEHP